MAVSAKLSGGQAREVVEPFLAAEAHRYGRTLAGLGVGATIASALAAYAFDRWDKLRDDQTRDERSKA